MKLFKILKIMKIYEYEDSLFCYSIFIIASSRQEADKLCENCTFVQEHEIIEGLVLEGGGNG